MGQASLAALTTESEQPGGPTPLGLSFSFCKVEAATPNKSMSVEGTWNGLAGSALPLGLKKAP